MNTYLKYQPPVIQFLSLLSITFLFLLLNYWLSSYLFPEVNAVIINKTAPVTAKIISDFKWAQKLSSFFTFIFPALLFGYFSSPKLLEYIGARSYLSPEITVAAVLILFAVQPFASWLGDLNAHINFGSKQQMIQDTEALYNRIMSVFLQMHSVPDLIINLFVMALLPAVAEELFFRGSLQKALLRLLHYPWLAIMFQAIIFGLLHGTFLKLLPIFVLGILLGTVYYVTQNLWYNIIIHFLNNALAVIAVYFSASSATIKKIANDEMPVAFYWGLLSLAVVIAVVYYIWTKRSEILPETETDEENDYTA